MQSFRQPFSFLLLSVHKRLCYSVEQRAHKARERVERLCLHTDRNVIKRTI